jgi:hypothetical protein
MYRIAKLNKAKKYLLTVLSLLTVLLVLLWRSPATAINPPVKMPEIEVKTPQDLNLDYLNHSIPRPIADLVGSIIPAARSKVQNTQNIEVAIPIPSPRNSPVASAAARSGVSRISPTTQVTDIATGRSRPIGTTPGRYEVVANRNPSGRAEPITPPSLDGMFAEEERRGGVFNRSARNLIHGREYLVADTSGKYAQANDILTLDLIAIDTQTNRYVQIDGVNADSFCVDALHAVIDNTWRINDQNVEDL